MNVPLHYFGVHTKCKSYFCTKTTNIGAIGNLRLLKEDGLYYEIMNLSQVYFAGNAKSLLENQSNNPAEQFNNIVAKFLGAKIVCYSTGRSYDSRVAMAAVHHNSNGHGASEYRKYKLGNELEVNRKRKLRANEAALQLKPRCRHRTQDTNSAAYSHGEGFEDLDKSPELFEKCKDLFLKK